MPTPTSVSMTRSVERYVMFSLVLLAYSTHHRIRNVVNAGVMYHRLALVAAAAMIAPAPTKAIAPGERSWLSSHAATMAPMNTEMARPALRSFIMSSLGRMTMSVEMTIQPVCSAPYAKAMAVATAAARPRRTP